MVVEDRTKARPNPDKPKNTWATQYDRELIVAARDNLEVHLYFSPSSLVKTTPDLSGKITVVDRYMVKLKVPVTAGFTGGGSSRELWVQKHNIAGLEVDVQDGFSKRAMEVL